MQLTTHHVRTLLTIAQKHTTNFTRVDGTHPFNCLSEDHHQNCNSKRSKKSGAISASLDHQAGDDDCTFSDSVTLRAWMKYLDINTDDARCTARDRRRLWSSGEWCSVLAIKNSFTSQNEIESAIQGRNISGSSASLTARKRGHTLKGASTKQ